MSDAQNLFYMLEDYHIAYVLESQWVVICLQYMILILIMFSHENVIFFLIEYILLFMLIYGIQF